MSNLHFLVDKAAIATCNLAPVILNFAESPALDKMQFSIQFNWRWTLQLVNGNSSELQKVPRYFNVTTNFVSFTELFVLLTASFLSPRRTALYLNDWELSTAKLTLLTGGSSLLNYHTFFEYLNNFHYIQSNCIYVLQCKCDLRHQ